MFHSYSRIFVKIRYYAVQRRKQIYCLLCGVTTCGLHIPFLMGTKDISFMAENNIASMSENSCISGESEFSWLDEFGPKFGVSAKNIKILHEPSQFFQNLKDYTLKATKRITLASLYIGTGPLEEELISCLHSALEKSDGKVKAKVLVDFTRGSRGQKNTRTLLLPLLRDFPCDINVALYHTPSLRGWIKTLLPERWNETISLTHLKVYLFDNTIILSGANLSDQYFTNRQDRYIIFENCPHLADYFDNLVNTVSTFSFQLRQDNSIVLHQNWSIHPYEGKLSFKLHVINENETFYIVNIV
ncbi:CDP-diacylglycerol--glycerol-3-phosphate 3-phosphatidyltransferase, mitochondrial-like, partial [Centruroides sculpturatus]|uniref:CDP-diacylglycerol--glycerol-3-phosphate 3-phosphatidyltransferase, mitochondrial-like n=1 Tax=Centruroides sculpturatus TaxID=218467 RepID=UPI000C6CE436